MVYMAGGLYGLILDDPKILHFFCAGGDVGLKTNHPKYFYLPIGLFREADYKFVISPPGDVCDCYRH